MELFKIPEQNMPELEKKIISISKRGSKIGTGPIVLQILTKTVEQNDDGSVNVFNHVTFTGDIPKIEGWEFLARIDHNNDRTGASNLIYTAPDKELPAEYRSNPADCDHCVKTRKRRDTFILRNTASGELKQIGRTCIKDFIGHDPKHILMMFEYLRRAATLTKEYTDIPTDMNNHRFINLQIFLGFVARAIRKNGWTSKSVAHENGSISTCSYALDDMFPANRASIYEVKPTDDDKDVASAAIQHVLGLDKDKNDYIHNIVTIAETGYVDWKATGYAASIVRVYQNYLERLKEESNRVDTSNSKHVGERKERLELSVRIIFKRIFNGYYGTTTIIKMFSDDGDVFVTFSTGNFNPNMDDILKIRGTVKDHQSYKGESQTILNRVVKLA